MRAVLRKTKRLTERQTGQQTDIQTDIQSERKKNRQGRQTDMRQLQLSRQVWEGGFGEDRQKADRQAGRQAGRGRTETLYHRDDTLLLTPIYIAYVMLI